MGIRYYPETGFVFDEDGKLIIKGSIENNEKIYNENIDNNRQCGHLVFTKFTDEDYEDFSEFKFVPFDHKKNLKRLEINEKKAKRENLGHFIEFVDDIDKVYYDDKELAKDYEEHDRYVDETFIEGYNESEHIVTINAVELITMSDKREKEFLDSIIEIVEIDKLPINIFISKGQEGKIPIIKFQYNKDLDEFYSYMPAVSIDSNNPTIRGHFGSLSRADVDYLRKFISKNYRTFLSYWIGDYNEEQVLNWLDFDV